MGTFREDLNEFLLAEVSGYEIAMRKFPRNSLAICKGQFCSRPAHIDKTCF